jgi:DNA helicase-2/ATP-dependent DNA helicase PcrA
MQAVDALAVSGSLSELNPQQQLAATHDLGGAGGPLLIIAGAGSGKTRTLAQRVALLVESGVDPMRILLLTFSRRAAGEMTRRAQHLAQRSSKSNRQISWAGTFHSIANRILRLHGRAIGLNEDFTILDREDAEDVLDLVRAELGFATRDKRFPKKATCLSIYSRVVNTQVPLDECVREAFPWCQSHVEELRVLFRAYVEAKQKRHLLDYDDLLLYWFHLMTDAAAARAIGQRFDHVLVDEYQDTNTLQSSILRALKPSGAGITAVGDDAQAIYSFRGATVRNILDYPHHFERPAHVITLEQNYRSIQPILDAANEVIGLASERHSKALFSLRKEGRLPVLASAEDEPAQVDYVVTRILERREEGVPLKEQAVLFRAAHHSDALEVELSRRQIPFVKYGGLKFLEAAHVKDFLCILRWAENPRDSVAGFRTLQLLEGIGPASARRALEHLATSGHDLSSLGGFAVPRAATGWRELSDFMAALRPDREWPGQLGRVRQWYEPQLERLYDAFKARQGDLDQLEQVAHAHPSRERFISELTLDPPEATGQGAVPPHLDEDYLVLSTIHSAKGQEWDTVFVLNTVDGCIPSDMAAGSPGQLEEERRLLYVAMTRAKNELHLVHPFRMFIRQQARYGDAHVYTPRTRFIPDGLLRHFERLSTVPQLPASSAQGPSAMEKVRQFWG